MKAPEAYHQGYVEGLSDARTTLAGFFSCLLETWRAGGAFQPPPPSMQIRYLFGCGV